MTLLYAILWSVLLFTGHRTYRWWRALGHVYGFIRPYPLAVRRAMLYRTLNRLDAWLLAFVLTLLALFYLTFYPFD